MIFCGDHRRKMLHRVNYWFMYICICGDHRRIYYKCKTMPLNAALREAIMDFTAEGVVITREWLLNKGYSRHAIDNLVKSRQLVTLQRGVYAKSRSKFTWQSIIYSLQSLEKLDLVIGGLTALEMQGFGHYLSLANEKVIYLYGTGKLPVWVNKVLPNTRFIQYNITELTGRKQKDKEGKSFTLESFTRQIEWNEYTGPLTVSSPERAFLEVLMDVPKKVSFEHGDQLMQGLTTLSPRSLQKLLDQCKNIKVKRLFFWFADRYHYPWLEKIDRSTIDLGKGKRMLVKGGKLDSKYQITVPEIL
jgi:hypothetical protein